jgi:hypothetical protein
MQNEGFLILIVIACILWSIVFDCNIVKFCIQDREKLSCSCFRADKLSPLAVPFLDRVAFPPEVTKEIPKVIFPGNNRLIFFYFAL